MTPDEFDHLHCQYEDSVLGAAIVEPPITAELALEPGDFWRPIQRDVYFLLCGIADTLPDARNVGGLLWRAMQQAGLKDHEHDQSWLQYLANRSNSFQARYDATQLKKIARMRKIRRLAAEVATDALRMDIEPTDVISRFTTESAQWTATADDKLPVPLNVLTTSYPELRPPVVHGLLRVGETANIIAPPKVGKSFLAGNLAWCVATGRPWLSHRVEQGKVLIIDNELHPETLVSRLTHIADKMQIELDDRSELDVISLRGRLTPIDAIETVAQIPPGRYRLIVLDALYRMIPPGTSENDNAGMMAIYNHLDKLADRWQSSLVVVHHASRLSANTLATFAEVANAALVPAIEAVSGATEFWANATDSATRFAVGAVAATEVAFENWGAIVEQTMLKADLAMLSWVKDVEYYLTENVPAYATWFADNWLNIFQDLGAATITVFQNMGHNLGESAFALFDWISSGFAGGFEGLSERLSNAVFVGIMDGFEARSAPLPEIMDRQLSDGEMELLDKIGQIGTDLGGKFNEKFQMRMDQLNLDKLNSKFTVDLSTTGKAAVDKATGELRAVESRLLTRGRADDPIDKVASNTEKTAREIVGLRQDLKQNQGKKPDQLAVKVVGA